MARAKSSWAFASKALPFLAMMGFGSWGLSQFLRMPMQIKVRACIARCSPMPQRLTERGSCFARVVQG